ncbi:MAG: tRNA (adenosine(37)-N6)-dimethylallyltransferase MiaA [Treponema sp.]|nr:tRNA (adenosine(37)-N6)-dimethylallyltransferase MiaA [Treponema sp.]
MPVLALFGPTASGKTNILFELFNSRSEDIGGRAVPKEEIISADSMQVYRGMDIGTAKPSKEEREKLPHHLIDIRDPREQFNAGDFVRLAKTACAEIASRGNLPVVSGGAGFYLKNFILGLSEAPPSDKAIREQLKIELKEKGAAALMDELAACDPVSAKRIHINDEYRILRAVEVFRTCGQPLSSFKADSRGQSKNNASDDAVRLTTRSNFRFIIIGLSCPRDELYSRINQRCEEMFKAGLADEALALFNKGYTPDDPGLRAIGYREFFVKEIDDAGAVKWRLSRDTEGVKALIARNSRRYAKRQITFFSGIPDVHWINCGDKEKLKKIKDLIAKN